MKSHKKRKKVERGSGKFTEEVRKANEPTKIYGVHGHRPRVPRSD